MSHHSQCDGRAASEDVSPEVATDDADSTSELLAFLSDPKSYAERPGRVERAETHISWVFLTNRYAYKLKKPVSFDFLDFSTVEQRHDACRAEVDLNSRLARHVYLGVIPITKCGARLRIGGDGKPIDWMVRMRRLPQERSLDRLIRSNSLTDAEVRQIGTRLTAFYQDAPPLSLRTDEYRRRVEEHVLGNAEELQGEADRLDQEMVKRTLAAQLRVLRVLPHLLDDRARDGRILDGHGDLRPDHVYLTQPIAIIDCIEFSAEFRQLDALDELSFLAVECEMAGDRTTGGRILQHYCAETGDEPARPLLPFYMCYRACVRAKVHALRSRQVADVQRRHELVRAANYLQLADHYAAETGAPLLFVVRGGSGSGKSTLSSALGQTLGLDVLSTDVIRREIFGASPAAEGYGDGDYGSEARQRVYDEMIRRAERVLSNGSSLILDGTFLTTKQRTQARSLARRLGVIPVMLECFCPVEVAAERIRKRSDALSDALPEFAHQQAEAEEADPAGMPASRIDTTLSLPAMLQDSLEAARAAVESG